MSGALVGGVVGAVIGFFTPAGPQLGWLIGSTIGGLIRPSTQSGPDLTDLKPQASEYGRPIPIVYSTMAVGGNIIWAADLVKTSDGSSGGKGGGGGGATGPTYAANFAILICESDGSMGLGRIWAGPDKRLIYNPVGAVLESGSITFYNGEEIQLPDPLMEAALGVGNVPAYRGYAYIVVEGFDVSKYDGNRIPFLTIEVGHEPTVTPGLGTVWFDRMFYDSGDQTFIAMYHGSQYGAIVNHASDKTLVHNRGGDNTYFNYAPNEGFIYDASRNRVVRLYSYAVVSGDDQFTTLDLNTGSVTYHDLSATLNPTDIGTGAVASGSNYVFVFNKSGGGVHFVIVDPSSLAVVHDYVVDSGNASARIQENGLYPGPGSKVFAVWYNQSVRMYDLTSPSGPGTSTSVGTAPSGFTPHEGEGSYDPRTDTLWLMHLVSGGTIRYSSHQSTGQLSNSSIATSFFSFGYSPWLFTPDPGDGTVGVWLCGSRWLAVDHYIRFDPVTGLAISVSERDGVYVGINAILTAMYNEVNDSVTVYRYNGFWSETTSGDLYPYNLPYNSGYLGNQDSSLAKQTLAEVVTDLSLRAGLTVDDIDVTQLTDTVDGYTLAAQMTVKDAISALMPAYYFDAVESNGIVKFVKRGGALDIAIPDEDLGAFQTGTDNKGDLYQTQRVMDEELPWTFTVGYVLEATNYSTSSKYQRKLVGYSANEESIEFPMVLTDTKAQEIANVNLHDRWTSRISYTFNLTRKYSYLEPTSIVAISGYTMRLTKMTQRDGGIFDCEAVRDDSDVYTPVVIVEETPGFPPVINQPSLTTLELM